MWNLRRYLLDFVLEIYKNIQLYHLVYWCLIWKIYYWI
jgi:hypothetical protein